MSKKNKLFKEKLITNKTRGGRTIDGNYIEIHVGDIVVKLNVKNQIVRPSEVHAHMESLVHYRQDFEENEKILLSTCCDCMWDVQYTGMRANDSQKKLYFKIC